MPTLTYSDKPQSQKVSTALIWIIIVAALGYFVDIYDLVLFSVVRVASLKGIGITDPAQVTREGLRLLNIQMGGMLAGGFLWGVLGDKRGRLQVLFGSILLYSLANILNGFAHDLVQFGWLRFFAGLGLAGEIGAGITLVTESMSAAKRGYGTMIVGAVGLLGAAVASLVGATFSWQTSFFLGGTMGLVLLVMRIGIQESGMYTRVEKSNVPRGDLRLLFNSWPRVRRYIYCFCIALPLWFMIGILITLGPEFGQALHIKGHVSAGKGILYTYLGTALGDIFTGLLSQVLKSRKKVVAIFLLMTLGGFFLYLNAFNASLEGYYAICFYLGFSNGFWILFITLSAEQFGTNLRATVATSVPNVVRGSVIPITALFVFLRGYTNILHAALYIGLLTCAIAFVGSRQLAETFGKNLDYDDV